MYSFVYIAWGVFEPFVLEWAPIRIHVNMHLWYYIIYSSVSAPPSAPTITWEYIHPEEVTVTWTSVPTATSYSVSINGPTPVTLPADACTYSFPRQANITDYTVSVVAINRAGRSGPARIQIQLGTCMSNNAHPCSC